MARPRTATNILQLRGAGKKHPERMREREGEMEAIGSIGEPPDWLTEPEKVAWADIVGMVPDGCLGKSDAAHVAMVSKLYAFAQVTPVADIPMTLMGRLMAGLGLMGMTPADRSKVKIGKGPATNPFTEL